ncbi:hypothetical protein [Roseitranquillus sediminis]|uniref:hypothetical protein n=1 Tax=Roseitranquillus sediminis TaxID=2809051 RepID=UPI001D0CB46B|nr:hypothetical protein [Roseitranquillus sediminis]MBM9593433.1 hypothetical protein [Roseitranquillus sediminis]
MPEEKVNLDIDALEVVDDDPDFVKITAEEIVNKIKELKDAGGLEGGVGVGVVW